MEKKREPFELVIHIDEDGARATASYRTRVFDDDGTVLASAVDSVTLKDLGNDFPWSDFIDASLRGSLQAAESACLERDQAKTELATAKASLEENASLLKIAQATIADRENLLMATKANLAQAVTVAAQTDSWLADQINARASKVDNGEAAGVTSESVSDHSL